MEAILLCLLLNIPHVFSLTQHRFILIQFSTLTCVLHIVLLYYCIIMLVYLHYNVIKLLYNVKILTL